MAVPMITLHESQYRILEIKSVKNARSITERFCNNVHQSPTLTFHLVKTRCLSIDGSVSTIHVNHVQCCSYFKRILSNRFSLNSQRNTDQGKDNLCSWHWHNIVLWKTSTYISVFVEPYDYRALYKCQKRSTSETGLSEGKGKSC